MKMLYASTWRPERVISNPQPSGTRNVPGIASGVSKPRMASTQIHSKTEGLVCAHRSSSGFLHAGCLIRCISLISVLIRDRVVTSIRLPLLNSVGDVQRVELGGTHPSSVGGSMRL